MAGFCLPTVGGSKAESEDRPLLVEGDAVVLLLPDVAGEGGFVGLVSVSERCLVSCKPLLEGVGCEPDILLDVAGSFYSALALSIQGAGRPPAVATFSLHLCG